MIFGDLLHSYIILLTLDFYFSIRSKQVSFDSEYIKDETAGDKRKWQEKKSHKRGTFTSDEVDVLKNAVCSYVRVRI